MMEWPLGERESLKTEFKRADALRAPASIAREAVGFLNAEGGEIWIGVGESGGVADSIEAIPDPEKKRDRLQDALVDLVEPSPMIGKEVAVDVVRFPADAIQGLLRVRVSHGRRPPYALLRRTMRAYLKRTGSRIRPMTREELAAAFTQRSGEVDLATEVVRRLEADLQKWAEDGFAGLKVLVRAAAKVVLALERETLEPLLRNPRLTGNRPLGWNFTSNSAELRPFHPGGCRLGKEGSAQWMSIWARGDLEFSAALDRLHWQGQPKTLWPHALLEFPASVVRLARTLYAKCAEPPEHIALGLGLFQVKGWTLAPRSPASIGYQMANPEPYTEEDHFLGVPVVVRWADLEDSADRCAYLLVRQVYQAFGYEDSDIPREYDRDTGQLRFPG